MGPRAWRPSSTSRILREAQSLNTQRDFTANIGGDVFKLPGGEVKLAIGYENRRETAKFAPDDFYLQALGQAQVTAVSGEYHTNEVYAETLIPIFGPSQNIPFLHRLEFEGAARRVDNSVAGAATTWTEGIKWAPIQDVMFRANRTKSIRAPAITELFLPSATVFSFANDPCDKNFYQQGTAPATRKANCIAAGIDPTTFVSNVVNATAHRHDLGQHQPSRARPPIREPTAWCCSRAGYRGSTFKWTISTSS